MSSAVSLQFYRKQSETSASQLFCEAVQRLVDFEKHQPRLSDLSDRDLKIFVFLVHRAMHEANLYLTRANSRLSSSKLGPSATQSHLATLDQIILARLRPLSSQDPRFLNTLSVHIAMKNLTQDYRHYLILGKKLQSQFPIDAIRAKLEYHHYCKSSSAPL